MAIRAKMATPATAMPATVFPGELLPSVLFVGGVSLVGTDGGTKGPP